MRENLDAYKSYLAKVRIPIRIACNMKNGWPVVISLWFIYDGGYLYCATQESARIVEYLLNNPRCGFEIAEDRPPYCGIRGRAKARIDKSLGPEILEKLLVRYLGDIHNSLAKKLLAKRETEVAIVLEPSQVFSWDFSGRMSNLDYLQIAEKVCP